MTDAEGRLSSRLFCAVEVSRLYDALTDVIEPAAIGPWFVTPNEAFDGLKPLEIIERGEIDRLWDMADRLRCGMPSSASCPS